MGYVRAEDGGKPERKAYPSDLSDAAWLLIEPLMPDKRARGQPRIHDRRELLNAMLYVLHNGCVWRALPHDLPNWQTVYHYYRDWRDDGTWQRVHDALRVADRQRVGRAAEPTAGSIDSQTVKSTEKGGSAATMARSA